MYFWGVSPVLVANYRFNSQTGVIVPDASKKLGPGYLGASTTISIDTTTAPAYSTTEQGIIFSSASQYITLPTFTPVAVNPMCTASISLNFWIKLTSLTAGTIIRYSTSTVPFCLQ